MDLPLHLLEKYKLASSILEKSIDRRTERGEILKQLLEPININRVSNKFKPMSIARISMLLPKEIPTKDLYTLLAKCKEAGELARNKRNFATEEEKKKLNTYESAFSKYFYWSLKTK